MSDPRCSSCGDALPAWLEAFGITHVFGIPGVHTVSLYRALSRSGLTHVTPRHEQGAGFMADGYARSSGRVAACFVITGPGLTNIATAMAQALADSIPMLVVSSVNARDQLDATQGRLHALPNQQAFASQVSVFSHTLQSGDQLPVVLARAFACFRSGRPGPVHLEIPLDVMAMPAPRPPVTGLGTSMIAPPPQAAPSVLDLAADWLREAKSPLVILGGGCRQAPDELRRLVDALGAPVLMTTNAKGIVPPTHPLSLGSRLPQPPVLEHLRVADVVLAIGTELGETDTLLFDSRPCINGRVIRVDIDRGQLSANVPASLAVLGDAGGVARGLAQRLEADASPSSDRSGVYESVRLLRQRADEQADPRELHLGRLLDAMLAPFPELVVVGDSTQLVYSGNLHHDAESACRWFNSATGFGTLGYALPAAIGAALASPDNPVVCLVGDGGLQFSQAELASARELGLPLLVLLWNNHGYGEIRRYMLESDVEPVGVDLFTPDFLALARANDWHADIAHSLAHLHTLMTDALTAERPTLIEISEPAALQWTLPA